MVPKPRGADVIPGMTHTPDEKTMQNEGVADHFMTLPELSGYLAVPIETLRRWRKHNEGPPAMKFGHTLRFRRSAVDAWADAHTEQVA